MYAMILDENTKLHFDFEKIKSLTQTMLKEVIADLIATYGEEIMDITNSIFERYKKNRGDFYL